MSGIHPDLPPPLDDIARRTRRLDLAASVLTAPTIAVIEMGGALAKKGFNATDHQVALLTSGQSLGLMLSFFIVHLAARQRKLPLVVWPEVFRSIAFMLVGLLEMSMAMGFVILHGAAQMFQSMTVPARVTIYDHNYPPGVRGRIVGRNRQVQLVIAVLVSLGLSAFLDGTMRLDSFLSAMGLVVQGSGDRLLQIVPLIGFLGLLGALLFTRVPVSEQNDPEGSRPRPVLATLKAFFRVWWEDREFRRYENFFFLFGFANIMTISLTQIHAVDQLGATYFDLAMINVAIVQGLMALTMVQWGKLIDRYPPQRLRGYINIIFAVDFLALAIAPNIHWVYAGRVFRGIALGGGTLIWMLGALYYARTPQNVPIYLGVHTVLTGLRWALAPFAGVWLKAVFMDDARPVFFAVFLIVAITAVFMIRGSRHEAPRKPLDGPPMPAPRMTGA
ncbi:MAG TPA: MFS transporter [Planctomycetota bacterium]|nr:MFS transporter [Planctomycetota bacterium]